VFDLELTPSDKLLKREVIQLNKIKQKIEDDSIVRYTIRITQKHMKKLRTALNAVRKKDIENWLDKAEIL
jgi:hypothetical protein